MATSKDQSGTEPRQDANGTGPALAADLRAERDGTREASAGLSATAASIGMGLAAQSATQDGQAALTALDALNVQSPLTQTSNGPQSGIATTEAAPGEAPADPEVETPADFGSDRQQPAAEPDTTEDASGETSPPLASDGEFTLFQPSRVSESKTGNPTGFDLRTDTATAAATAAAFPSAAQGGGSTPSASVPPPATGGGLLGDGGLLDNVVGEDGIVSGVVDDLLGEGGLVDEVLDGVLGEDGLLGDVVGEGGLVDGLLDGVTGEDGLLGSVFGEDGVLDGVLGENGLLDQVIGDEGLVEGVLGSVTGTDGLLNAVAGEDGLLDGVVGEGGMLDPVIGEGGVLDDLIGADGAVGALVDGTGLLDPVTGEGGVLDTVAGDGGLLDDVVGEDGVLDTVVGEGGLVDGLIGDAGLLGGLTGGLLGGSSEGGETLPQDVSSEGEQTVADGLPNGLHGAEDGILPGLFGDVGAVLPDLAAQSDPAQPEGDFLDTMIGAGRDDALFDGLLGGADPFGIEVGDLVGNSAIGGDEDDLFLGLGGEDGLTGSLVDDGILDLAGHEMAGPADPEIDDLINDLLGDQTGDIIGDGEAFGALLGDETGPDEGGLFGEPGDGGTLGDINVDDAIGTLFGDITDSSNHLLDGLNRGQVDDESS